MFLRIRRTIEVLRVSTEAPDPMYVGLSRVPDTSAVIAQRQRESGSALPRPANPAVRVIELAVLIVLSIYLVSPIVGLVFDLQTERGVTLLASIVTGTMCFFYHMAAQELQGRLARLVRLDFLDPFFGRRLRRTIDILKRGA